MTQCPSCGSREQQRRKTQAANSGGITGTKPTAAQMTGPTAGAPNSEMATRRLRSSGCMVSGSWLRCSGTLTAADTTA